MTARSRRWVLGAAPLAAGLVAGGRRAEAAASPGSLTKSARKKIASALAANARSFGLKLDAKSLAVGVSSYATVIAAGVAGFAGFRFADLSGGKVIGLLYLGLRQESSVSPGFYAILANSDDFSVQVVDLNNTQAPGDHSVDDDGEPDLPPHIEVHVEFYDIDVDIQTANYRVDLDFDFTDEP